jgi:nucleoid DNA-binding protein
MRKALFGLAALIGLLTVTANAQITQKPAKVAPDLKAGIARETKFKEATVDKMLKAMAPAIKEQLRAGRVVTIDGVGTFQVVRIEAYNDLIEGRPQTVPARNYIEFVPDNGLNEAANADGAVPARTVKGYKFQVDPQRVSGQKSEGVRTPGRRTR